jgi:hypothetical protein
MLIPMVHDGVHCMCRDVNQVLMSPCHDIDDFLMKTIFWLIILCLFIIFEIDTFISTIVIVVVVDIQVFYSTWFAVFFFTHVVTGTAIEMPVSVGFVSSSNLLQHVHTVFSYMPYKESMLTWQIVVLLLWAVFAMVTLFST